MFKRYVTDAAQQEPSFWKPGQTPALLTPGYLTIVTPIDDAVLLTKEVIEISAALPYARGRRQEPIGERVIVNDLYGIPLYKPAMGPIDPDLGTGAIAAKRIIAETGADPNFVSDLCRGRDQASLLDGRGAGGPLEYVPRSRGAAVHVPGPWVPPHLCC